MACATAVLDAAFGSDRIRLGKTNEPDRTVPGDVALRSVGAVDSFDRVFEVRDKGVEAHTVQAVAVKATTFGIRKMTVLAVNQAQATLDLAKCRDAARDIGVDLAIFIGWAAFINSIFMWSSIRESTLINTTITQVRQRLKELGRSMATVSAWDAQTAKPDDSAGTKP